MRIDRLPWGEPASHEPASSLVQAQAAERDGIRYCLGTLQRPLSLKHLRAEDVWHLVRVQSGQLTWRGHRARWPQACTGGSDALIDGLDWAELDLTAETVFESLTVPASALQRLASASPRQPHAGRIVFRQDLSGQKASVDMLLHLGRAWRCALAEQPRSDHLQTVLGELARTIVTAFLSCLEQDDRVADEARQPPQAVPGSVIRAIEYMRVHIARPFTLQELARAAGASPRTLQSGFRAACGCSPWQFLRRQRLEGTRRELLDPDNSSSISAIAARWGFTHMGMFARYYREAFGELPRATRRT